MSSRCRQCDCRVPVEDDGGFCSYDCHALFILDNGSAVQDIAELLHRIDGLVTENLAERRPTVTRPPMRTTITTMNQPGRIDAPGALTFPPTSEDWEAAIRAAGCEIGEGA